jgi:hypothetical protein
MKLTVARLKSLIREEFSRMSEGFDSVDIEVEAGETPEQVEQKAMQAAQTNQVVMLTVPMSMKEDFIEYFGDNGRHGPIDDERYSLTYKN